MKQKRFRKWAGLIGLICLVLFTLVPVALAFESRGGDTVVIGAGEVIEDDLYVGATNFTLNGTVKGDLIVGGNIIEINGAVEGDLTAAGQTVVVRGTVTDDVRIAGQALILDSDAQVAMTRWPPVLASRTRRAALWAATLSTQATRPSWPAMWPKT